MLRHRYDIEVININMETIYSASTYRFSESVKLFMDADSHYKDKEIYVVSLTRHLENVID